MNRQNNGTLVQRETLIDKILMHPWSPKLAVTQLWLRYTEIGKYQHLFAMTPRRIGLFLIWNGSPETSVLDSENLARMKAEASAESVMQERFIVFAAASCINTLDVCFREIPVTLQEYAMNPGRGLSLAA